MSGLFQHHVFRRDLKNTGIMGPDNVVNNIPDINALVDTLNNAISWYTILLSVYKYL